MRLQLAIRKTGCKTINYPLFPIIFQLYTEEAVPVGRDKTDEK